MPELPEVEVIRRGLEPLLAAKTFAAPRILFAGSIRHPSAAQFRRRLPGRRIDGLGRIGKYLIIGLDCGELVVHLRMTGRLVFLERGKPPARHLRAALPFSDGSMLYFSDMRKFGGLWLLESAAERDLTGLGRLGPDIYEQVDRHRFEVLMRSRCRARLKPLLLDQRFVAGLGNIYVDESLFRSRLHPCRAVSTLSREEIARLYEAIRSVLEEGIGCGGTSARDYVDARGEQGDFQNRLSVYGHKGRLCNCGTAVTRITVAGRGTYYCPQCQKE
ncbi:MAG: bifunctional DNA-formamidopyrimidine glycosylase/DNA-(apurinic or apyrimidinic site) lyase [Bacillota bacterium]